MIVDTHRVIDWVGKYRKHPDVNNTDGRFVCDEEAMLKFRLVFYKNYINNNTIQIYKLGSELGEPTEIKICCL